MTFARDIIFSVRSFLLPAFDRRRTTSETAVRRRTIIIALHDAISFVSGRSGLNEEYLVTKRFDAPIWG